MIVRPATDADQAAILALLRREMGWPDGPDGEARYRWKHVDNHFGRSVALVAVDGAAIIGVRLLMRWELVSAVHTVRAVRAVDTVTHADHRGRGVFTALTTAGLDELAAGGVDLVFNTPNAASLPGYRKLGWTEVGHLPVTVRPSSVRALLRMARSRAPAELESVECDVGVPAPEALRDDRAIDELLATQPAGIGLRTRRSASYLRWRYGAPGLRYRAVLRTPDVGDGVAFLRCRRRGDSTEAAVVDVLVPDGDAATRAELATRAVEGSRADYGLMLGPARARSLRWWQLPRAGPLLTCRPVGDVRPPPLGAWDLSLGDVELF